MNEQSQIKTAACCRKCMFFYLAEKWCRRYPPKLVAKADGRLVSYYPSVSETGWCGEYKPFKLNNGGAGK